MQVNAVLIIVVLTGRILQRPSKRKRSFAATYKCEMLGKKAKTEGMGGGEFFSKEIRLMDTIILIKSLCFKYTVEETKVLIGLGNHLENNCNLLCLVTNKSILQPNLVQ